MPSKDVCPALTLAMNYVTRPRALTHIQSWYERTALSEDHPDLQLSSQSLSKRDAKFIEWKAVNGRFEVSIRKNAVSQAINKMGKFVLFYRGYFSWEECLSLCSGKDVVEKGFDILKNYFELMPMNLRTDSSLRGYLSMPSSL